MPVEETTVITVTTGTYPSLFAHLCFCDAGDSTFRGQYFQFRLAMLPVVVTLRTGYFIYVRKVPSIPVAPGDRKQDRLISCGMADLLAVVLIVSFRCQRFGADPGDHPLLVEKFSFKIDHIFPFLAHFQKHCLSSTLAQLLLACRSRLRWYSRS